MQNFTVETTKVRPPALKKAGTLEVEANKLIPKLNIPKPSPKLMAKVFDKLKH